MIRTFIIFVATLFLVLPLTVSGQNPTKWQIDAISADLTAKLEKAEKVPVTISVEIEPGWYLYALDQKEGGPIATTIKVSEGSPFLINGAIKSDKPKTKTDSNFLVDGKPLETKFYENTASFIINVKSETKAKTTDLKFDVRFQVCNDTMCLPPRVKLVSFSGEEDVKKPVVPVVNEQSPIAGNNSGSPLPTTENRQPPTDIWGFLWLAATLGALSLLTPCVFPMIPITVSYFTNHSSGSRSRSIRLAAVYSIGIIATFTLLGMLLAIFVGAAGINLFAANPWVNILIAGIFLFFAFNLFGAYEITIPSSILSKLDSITRSQENEGSGIVGALLMGLTFTLTSFTCTSPFVGTILVSASQGDWQRPLVGMLAFSTVFALPFFLLALVPQWISQLPRAGGWMNSVKVAMGFLEIAAAMKFISNVDLVWKWGIFTRDVVLAVWIAIGIILAIYLLGKFQLSHDSKPERIGAFRLASAIISLSISFYLITGLFGAKLGELEAFLPPDLSTNSSRFSSNADSLNWIKNDYQGALAKAKTENKRVFIDFTGYTCTNCRWMEANIFPKSEVQAELKKFVLSTLYTDGDGEIYEQQQRLEQEKFGTVALPFYAILDGDGKTIATFPGLTRNTQEFVDFLKKGQEN